jgi:phosphoribosylformylglycinamidine synthase
MPRFSCQVYIRPRQDILDPQGDAVDHALSALGFSGVSGVRVGRYIELGLESTDAEAARAQLDQMCEKLLANPVTEDYDLDIEPA